MRLTTSGRKQKCSKPRIKEAVLLKVWHNAVKAIRSQDWRNTCLMLSQLICQQVKLYCDWKLEKEFRHVTLNIALSCNWKKVRKGIQMYYIQHCAFLWLEIRKEIQTCYIQHSTFLWLEDRKRIQMWDWVPIGL